MKIMTFLLGDALHAVEISTVEAVTRAEEAAARGEWSGLPRVDLAALLGYAGREDEEERRAPVLLVRSGAGRAIVGVERTGEVLEVPSDALRPAPHLFESRFLRGVIEHEDRLIPLLDGAALVDEARAARAEDGT